MDLIEATLAKKRSALDSATGGGKKKYIRRGDLEKQREQEYLAEQERERKEKEVQDPPLTSLYLWSTLDPVVIFRTLMV